MQPICLGFQPGDKTPCVHSIGTENDFCALPEIFRCVEYIRRHEPLLSYSTIRNSYCKRKVYYSFIQGIELIVKPMPMKLGEIASHIIDELHNKDNPSDKPSQDLTKYINSLADSDGNLPYQVMGMIGLFKGYKAKEMHTMKGIVQAPFLYFEDGYPSVRGFMDLKIFEDKIGYEFKYSGKPETYSRKFIVQDQVGTYFLGNPSLERITLRVIRVPKLIAKNETLEDYRDRIMNDFIARPRHYINDTNFWRSEFNYDALKEKYRMIASDIQRCIELGGINHFYQSNGPSTCLGEITGTMINPCEYLSICETGVVSDQIYRKREVR